MPFPRIKLKLVKFDEDGRKRTKLVSPNMDRGNQDFERSRRGRGQAAAPTTGFPNRPTAIDGPNDDDDDFDSPCQDEVYVASNERQHNRRSYTDIKRADCDRWEHLRESLFHTGVSMECPPDEAECQICSIKLMETETHRCVDCGPLYIVCHDCLQSDHCLRPNHCPEKWNVTTAALLFLKILCYLSLLFGALMLAI